MYLCKNHWKAETCMTMHSKQVKNNLKTDSFYNFGHQTACGLAKKSWFSIFFLSKKHVFNHTFCIIIVYLCNKSLDVEKCMTMRSKHVHKHLKTHSFCTFGHKKACGLAKKTWFSIFSLSTFPNTSHRDEKIHKYCISDTEITHAHMLLYRVGCRLQARCARAAR